MCLLSEPSYCGDGERKSDFDRAAFGHFLELQAQNANNINLVTPSHYVLQIREALFQAKKKGLTVPVVYNCGGYESVEALQALDGLIDIYLTDFKYMDSSLAKVYSRAEDYPKQQNGRWRKWCVRQERLYSMRMV